MRILLVTHRYPPLGVAGVERLSEQSALGLIARGHEVTVLTRHEVDLPAFPKLQRSMRRGVAVNVIAGGGTTHGRFPSLAPVLERMFERTLVEVDPDVVLVSHLLGHSPGYVPMARRWGVPVVIELHDFYTACERAHLQRPSGELCAGPEGGRACATHCFPFDGRALERWALRTKFFRHALAQADAAIAPSRFVADYLRGEFGTAIPPLHVIGNGVEARGTPSPGDIRPPAADGTARPLHIAYAGVVGPHKGPHLIVEALRLARLPSVRFSVFGAPVWHYFKELGESAARLPGVGYHAFGTFDPVELPILLSDVDAIVVPSLVWETYSIVAHEAMACGVPVLAARTGALPEVVRHGQNGMLFEPGSALDLATTLQMLDSDRGLLASLRAGIRRSDWISLDDRLARLESVLREVIAAGVPSQAAPGLTELSILRGELLEASAAGRL